MKDKILKKIISITLALTMILGLMPSEILFSYAAEEPKPNIKSLLVTKTYTDLNEISVLYIEVNGENLDKLGKNPVIVRDAAGEPKVLSIIVENDKKLYYKVDKPQGVTRFSVYGEDYNISTDIMPTITSIDPLNRMVESDDILTINGSGFDNEKVKINFYNKSGAPDNQGMTKTANKITKTFPPSTTGGPYRLEFVYEDTAKKLTIEDNYINLFTVFGQLGVSDDIMIIPNQGPTGTMVKIKGKELTKDMSVFFLKELDGSDSYSVDNRGIYEAYSKDVEENEKENNAKNIDVFTVKVPPKLTQGRYYVVLTNDVNKETNLDGKIISVKSSVDYNFTVIENADTIRIDDVNPDTAPETGVDSVISGKYIGTLSSNVFAPNDNSQFKEGTIDPNANTLKVSYGPKDTTKPIGKYKLIGGDDGVDVIKIERSITVYIGGRATFRNGSTYTSAMDKINIRVPEISLEEKDDGKRPVTIDVKTLISYKDKDGKELTITVDETGTWSREFQFEPINFKPKITAINPNKIPVDSDDEISESFQISIVGENFLKYRYTDRDGNLKVKYPNINLGSQVILDPNITGETITNGIRRIPVKSEDIRMFNKSGAEIDGTKGNELATKILLTIPKDVKINPNVIGQISRLVITNPIKNEEEITNDDPDRHMGLNGEGEIKFVRTSLTDNIKITDVMPNTVTTLGEKGVQIIGQNFKPGLTLYLDGEKINKVDRDGTGTVLTFDAPPKPEGYYQLLVQNEEGDLSVYNEFLYVKTYTDPKITDFNPKKGNANTLVTLKGQNLLPPNPQVTDLGGIGIYKLIGTRVLLGSEDMNDYYMVDGEISLQNYTTLVDNPIVKIEGNEIKLSDYHHSIILQEETSKAYYTLHFDNIRGEHRLTDGDKNIYELIVKDNKIFGRKLGENEKELTVENNELKIDGKILIIKTPYAIEGGLITGNRVKVLNNNELIFNVKPMPREGLYNVTIVNPDTKKDSKIGNDGFYYSFQPEFNPEIGEIRPKEGSTEGGYYINIIGDKFIDNGGDNKTSVIIGSLVVDPKDVEINPDGKSIKVKVPKYPGDLEKETQMDRKTVAVVLVNPDGGSASKEDGFTYIIPISHPKIDKLILNKGSAAGGESVIIEGSGFRFFEPYKDLDNNAQWDEGEPFTDLNGNEKWDDLRHWLSPELKIAYNELAKDYKQSILPILPKIYFGTEEVAIKDFTASTIEVETPKSTKGPVEVYVVNNDYGTSNKLVYTYESSNPQITNILPSTGRKQGNQKVEILGSGFKDSTVKVIDSINTTKEQPLVLVQFGDLKDGNVSNRDVPIDALQNSGKIKDRKTSVTAGSLTINYDATEDQKKLSFVLEEGTGDAKKIYTFEHTNYDDGEVFLPVNLLEDDAGNSYDGYEYVRIVMDRVAGANVTNRLRIDRGYSPEADLIGIGQVSLKTPAYYTIGKVAVTITNPDGGTATGSFDYKNPDSDPRITNITRDGQQPQLANGGKDKILTVNIKGGSTIVIEGTDFRDVKLIEVGNVVKVEAKDIIENTANRLVFKMPEVPDNATTSLHTVYVTNEDGGTASSDAAAPPIYVQFIKGESNPQIATITPPRGPSTGGNTVTLKGSDFRKAMDGHEGGKFKVYFDNKQIPEVDVTFIDSKTVTVKAPPGAPGQVKVKVENPDGEISNEVDYTYASSPKIASVVDPLDPTEKAIISVVSVKGNHEIKLKGSGFMEGATVHFAPKLTPVTGSEQAGGKIIYIEGNPYILEESTEGTDFKFINNETVTVKAPALKVGSIGVIIVNPDDGASPIYTNLTYGLPELAPPSWIAAELVYDRFIRVHWSPVSGANQYEIFVVVDGKTTELIGNTQLTSFVYNDLKPNTKYKFVVKAVGEFGSSKASLESNIVTTGLVVGPPDEDGGLAENTTMSKTGNMAKVTIGSKDKALTPLVIDLTTGSLAGATDLVISMPASVITGNGSRNIQVVGKDFSLNFKPSAFNVSTVRENSSKADAGVRFTVGPNKGNTQVPSGNDLSTVYNLDASVYVGKTNTVINQLVNPINLTLAYDLQKANLRKLNHISFNNFNAQTNSWEAVGFPTNTVINFVSGSINRLGKYTVVGRR